MKPPQTHRVNEFSDSKRARMMRAVSQDGPSRAKLFQRVYSGSASPRQAIKAQCLHCAWLDEAVIRSCTATECPLWGFRPFRDKGGNR